MARSYPSLKVSLALGVLLSAALFTPSCTDDERPSCPPELEGALLTCGVGACFTVTPACVSGVFAECEAPPPTLEEICANGIDDNCDGAIDEGCSCLKDETQACFPGSPSLRNLGDCRDGQQACEDGAWSIQCDGARLPQTELCDGLDNSCDGQVDEGCTCVEGQEQKCYGGLTETRGVGRCKDGKQTCQADGRWGECVGDVVPGFDLCNGLDDDCDGTIDPPPQCSCVGQEARPCYGGPDGTDGVGACHAGTQSCDAGAFGPCVDQVTPTPELCNTIDDDCDGVGDDQDVDINQGEPCFTGLAGVCADGLTKCSATGEDICVSLVTPAAEVCNGKDDDCDGTVDLVVGLDGKLYPILADPQVCSVSGELGECQKGQNVCSAGGIFHCVQVNFPVAETCDLGDEDCDGVINNGEICCPNNSKDGSETDVDCGGVCVDQKCPPGKSCFIAKDCDSGVCLNNLCQDSSCADLVQNDQETDIDCGGPKCAPCDDFKKCKSGADCVNKSCPSIVLTCQPPSCVDMSKNALEADIDCGGPICPRCNDSKSCTISADCQSGVCSGNICMSPTCSDTVQNGAEADVDCGGPVCAARCQTGKKCIMASDCVSGVCQGNVCQNPACNDFVKNGTETGVDCGGPFCVADCQNGSSCDGPNDCISKVCGGNVCQAQTCMDSVKNGGETDVDCGGPNCAKCNDIKACLSPTDCKSAVCTSNVCQVPVCNDSTKNGAETDVDCGGSCAMKCADNKQCKVGSDCLSKVCGGANTCVPPSCTDGFKNGLETDVDCGGSCVNKCNINNACLSGGDCASAHCKVPGGGGAGVCVECFVAFDCPGVDTECQTRTCMNNFCGLSFAASGTIVAGQMGGDCKVNQCNGAGQILPAIDNSDKPIDGNVCTQDVCASGAPSNPPTGAGSPCAQGGGLLCDGAGWCVQCLSANDCPGQNTECQTRACTSGVCGFAFAPAATPVSLQTPGDCKQNQCDGSGGVTTVNYAADLPLDGNLCTLDVCSAGVPSNPPAPPGQACGGGGTCNGAGTCVPP